MKKVIDSTVVLAVCHQEQGSDRAREAMRHGLISTVNLSEVYEMANQYGCLSIAQAVVHAAALEVVEFTEDHAVEAAKLSEVAKINGLSFADRACLSLGLFKKLPVVSGDRSWQDLEVPTRVELFRTSS